MKTFSATESPGMISGSWWTTRMPASCASRAEAKRTSRPSTRIVPASGACSPSRMRSRVDLPAPFSPTSAVTLAGGRSRLTPLSAWTTPNRLAIPRTATRVTSQAPAGPPWMPRLRGA